MALWKQDSDLGYAKIQKSFKYNNFRRHTNLLNELGGLNKKSDKYDQKQPSKCVLRKRCSENMQQVYRRTLMPKCDCNKVALKFY